VAPLRYGAGLKGKLFDALRFGTPSVTTSVGLEGICEAKFWNGVVCDLPEKFVEAAVTLYSDEKLWNEAQAKGKHILLTRFSEEVFLPEFAKRIQTLHANLRFHRRNNVTGSLLWHHSAQSTKYLSKWIEAKNKNAQ
jgi:glycosyltransferase involved in cell wall biosynthesis